MIDIDYLKQLLEIFDESSANDLRIEQEGTSIKLSKSARGSEVSASVFPSYPYPPMQMQHSHLQAAEADTAPSAAARPAIDEPAAAAAEPAKNYHEIRSPIVGTFYSSPTPDSPAYVEVGQSVSPGEVLCIIEAMKLMNEIDCDAYGRIAKILVENAQPVEYNQLLFLIESE